MDTDGDSPCGSLADFYDTYILPLPSSINCDPSATHLFPDSHDLFTMNLNSTHSKSPPRNLVSFRENIYSCYRAVDDGPHLLLAFMRYFINFDMSGFEVLFRYAQTLF